MFCLSGDAQDSRSSDQFSRNDGGAEPNARRPRRRSRARVATEASEDTACNPIEAAARALTCEFAAAGDVSRSVAHTAELQTLMRISYTVYRLKNNNRYDEITHTADIHKK